MKTFNQITTRPPVSKPVQKSVVKQTSTNESENKVNPAQRSIANGPLGMLSRNTPSIADGPLGQLSKNTPSIADGPLGELSRSMPSIVDGSLGKIGSMNSNLNQQHDPPSNDVTIYMDGDRYYHQPSAEQREIAQLPSNPVHGQVYTFIYHNADKSTATSTYTYLDVHSTYNTDPNEKGRWEKGVVISNRGSGFKEAEYITLQEVQAIKDQVAEEELAKEVETVTNDLTEETTQLTEKVTLTNQLGTDFENVDTQLNIERKKDESNKEKTPPKEEKNKDKKDDKKKLDALKDKKEPPSITCKAEFKLRDDWFEKGKNRDMAYDGLREISNYLKENPNQKFEVHIYIQASGAKATDPVGGGFLQSGPETPYSGRPLSALAYGRFLTVKGIIQNQSGMNNVKLIYKPHYNSSVHMFKVVPQ